MDKQQKLKIALPVLFLVIGIVWWPLLTGSKPSKSGNNVSREMKAQSGNVSEISKVDLPGVLRRKRVRTSFNEWGRNPFVPGYDPKAVFLEGILWDERNPKAVINGYIRGPGDQIGPNYLTTIKRNSVIILTEQGNVEIFLGEGKNL